jgi:hypothetical protein
MGFYIPTAGRIGAQGPSTTVMRWDLMRPAAEAAPAPVEKPSKPPVKGSWKEAAVKELPPEVVMLSRCNERYWKNKTLATLQSDYRHRDERMAKVPGRIRAMAEAVAAEHNIPVYLIFGKTKVQRVVRARQELVYQLRHMPHRGEQPSLWRVARWLNLYDHTCVIHSVQAVEKRRAASQEAA